MSFLDGLEPDRMTDVGMFVWAGIVVVVSLAASWGVAVAWQRWREKSRT